MQETWIHSILSGYGLYIGTYIVCAVSGFVPIVNAELFLLMVSSMAAPPMLIPILLLSSLGQMTGKSIVYFGGKGSLKLSHKRYEKKINHVLETVKKWGSKVDILICISAFVGIPPFYLVALTSGIVQHNFYRFFASGFVGRVLRFGVILFVPQLCKELFRLTL